MSILDRPYSMAEVAEACDLPKEKFQLWNARYSLASGEHPSEGGGKRGKPRIYTFNHVMEFAVARAMVNAGMPPKTAFFESAKFAHVGDASSGQLDRLPGLPYPHDLGDTLFAVAGDRWWIGTWKRSDPAAMDEMMSHLGGTKGFLGVEGLVLVNTSSVFGNVCRRLGAHPFVVLDQVYAKV